MYWKWFVLLLCSFSWDFLTINLTQLMNTSYKHKIIQQKKQPRPTDSTTTYMWIVHWHSSNSLLLSNSMLQKEMVIMLVKIAAYDAKYEQKKDRKEIQLLSINWMMMKGRPIDKWIGFILHFILKHRKFGWNECVQK